MGSFFLLTNLLADCEAVHAGQHQIKQQKIKLVVQCCAQPGVSIRLDGDAMARKRQIVPLDGGDVRIVLDDEYIRHVSPPAHGEA